MKVPKGTTDDTNAISQRRRGQPLAAGAVQDSHEHQKQQAMHASHDADRERETRQILERHRDEKQGQEGRAFYADFRDFAFWELRVNAIRYIGGYGRMSWITQDDWQAAEEDPLAPSAAGAIAHMNADHADAMVLYCKAFSKATDISSATMTGVDRYGFEMSAKTPEGPRPIRVAFATPVTTPDELRAALVAMAKDSRSRLG